VAVRRLPALPPPWGASKKLLVLACASLCALALAACGTTASTAGFKGTEHDVAQTVVNLQSDITGGEEKKICENDLAAAVVSRLGGRTSCESTIKEQLAEIDNTELEVKSVKISGSSATVSVNSVHAGKKRLSNVALVEEGGKWKIDSIQ
jgi:copper chaperone CopZ